jgi:hypothetical protein
VRWHDTEDHSFLDELSQHLSYSRLPYPPFVFGIGIWFGPGVDAPTALLVLDEEDVQVKEPLRLGQWPGEPLIVGRVGDASDRLGKALAGFLGHALVIPCARPEPLAKAGSVLLDPVASTRGTLGVPVIRTSDAGDTIEGFLTAGHTVSKAGAQVVQSQRWFPSRGPSLGHVFLHQDPVAPPGGISRPGLDVAVVDLDPGQQPISPVSSGFAQLQVPVVPPVSVRIRGGFTRNGLGMICAGVFVGGSPRRQWRDCWLMGPGVAAQGDSGGCVLTTPGQELVGMLVGGARQGGRAHYAFHYVQDHDTVQQDFLTPAGVRLK